MKKTGFFILAVLIASAMLAPARVKGDEGVVHEVTVIRNTFKLNPQELTIKVGDTVKWTNTDERKHNLASIPGSGAGDELEIFAVMEPGDVYSHTFKVPGEYPYFCFIHNQMTGKITVEK